MSIERQNVLPFPVLRAGGAQVANGGQCLVTLSNRAPRCAEQDPFAYWLAGSDGEGWRGGVFVTETGEVLGEVSEPYCKRTWLEDHLSSICNRLHAQWLKDRHEPVPSWLLRAVHVRAGYRGELGWLHESTSDSAKAIRSFLKVRS